MASPALPFKNYYQILGVARTASEEEIKLAYRELAFKFHPDRNPNDPAAHQRFLDINEAYRVLTDVEARRKFNNRYASHHGEPRKGNSDGLAERIQMNRQRRANRYGRSQYNQRLRYRGTSYRGPVQPRSRPKSEGPQAMRSEHFDNYFIRHHEAEKRGYAIFGQFMQVICLVGLIFTLGLIGDYFLAEPTAKEQVLGQKRLPWSMSTPFVTEIRTQSARFQVSNRFARFMPEGTIVRLERTPIGRTATHVLGTRQGRDFRVSIHDSLYAGAFPWLIVLICLSLATLIFRINVEVNAYIGTVTVILGIIVFFILFA